MYKRYASLAGPSATLTEMRVGAMLAERALLRALLVVLAVSVDTDSPATRLPPLAWTAATPHLLGSAACSASRCHPTRLA